MADALIERLRAFASLSLPPENMDDQSMCLEAADALTELRDDRRKLLKTRFENQAEIAKLRDALEDCVGFMSGNIGGDVQQLDIMKEARAALGESND